MTSLGFAQGSPYRGPIRLDGDAKGASVLILGAGVAGMVAALELRQAGYRVQVLEYREKAGGRCWTLRGGDRYTEMGGFVQEVGFDYGLYLNPGPWRIPHHHYAVLDYCRRLGVKLEPFIQVNHNAFLHARNSFGGKPLRYRHIASDYNGQIAELLAKCLNQGALDQQVVREDKEILLEALRTVGVLDKNFRFVTREHVGEDGGYPRDLGGGPSGTPDPSKPIALDQLLRSGLWRALAIGDLYDLRMPMFQPVGGMDMIAYAFQRELGDVVRYRAKVTAIHQDDESVAVTFEDADGKGQSETATAEWCLCTIPFSILSQVEHNFSAQMTAAIDAVPYAASVKIGLQFKRRFWEEDEAIFGGITYTDLPISLIGYPSANFNAPGKGVLLGGYVWETYAYEFTSLSPEERVRKAVEFGSLIHPQYNEEFETGVGVGWHRVPWALGCYGLWTEETRNQHYKAATAIDGRTLMAGEHVSCIPSWQEGAILSSLDAISRLHQRVVTR
ncbi:flavin monoamine oxidase family protein [Mesorhizobium sp. M1423]|uniref:flavin monoamine oxidase family protein n=1 Tax=Mesorhizobium sp. M1423 TaxID=2957101 RepID=UPI003335CBBD